MDKSKLLWHSNGPHTPTGYGQQTSLFAPLLAERYDLALSAFYGLDGGRIRWNGIPIFPGNTPHFGDTFLAHHAASHFGGDPRGGLIVTLMDVWVLNPTAMAELDLACWCPVDHQPPPRPVGRFFAESGAIPIAMSRFGQEQLEAFDPLYCPHAVDVDVYKPMDKDEIRETVGIPKDAFVVGMVAANKGTPSRKGFSEAFQAFKLFRDQHDDAFLYLHTTMDSAFSEGEALGPMLQAVGIPAESVRIADQYHMMFDPYPRSAMAMIYSALDVLLNPAHGEGFGIPVLEAQACGVPAIVTKFSAMPEVCGSGWHVDGELQWTRQQSWQMRPSITGILESLNDAYGRPRAQVKNDSQVARTHALKYALRPVFEEYMVPALEAARARLDDRKPSELVAA